MATVNTAELM